MKDPPLKSSCSPRKWLGLASIEPKSPHTLENCFVVSFEAVKSLASKSTPLAEESAPKRTKKAKIKKICKRPGSSQARVNLVRQRIHAYRPILPDIAKVQQLFGLAPGDRGSVAQRTAERPLKIMSRGHNDIAKRRVRRNPAPDMHAKQLLKALNHQDRAMLRLSG
jgi:hypothetical protein